MVFITFLSTHLTFLAQTNQSHNLIVLVTNAAVPRNVNPSSTDHKSQLEVPLKNSVAQSLSLGQTPAALRDIVAGLTKAVKSLQCTRTSVR